MKAYQLKFNKPVDVRSIIDELCNANSLIYNKIEVYFHRTPNYPGYFEVKNNGEIILQVCPKYDNPKNNSIDENNIETDYICLVAIDTDNIKKEDIKKLPDLERIMKNEKSLQKV